MKDSVGQRWGEGLRNVTQVESAGLGMGVRAELESSAC